MKLPLTMVLLALTKNGLPLLKALKGLPPLAGAVVPFADATSQANYQAEIDSHSQTITFLGFMGQTIELPEELESIETIDIIQYGVYIPGFVVQKDSTINGISCEINASFYSHDPTMGFEAKVCLYTSPQGSSIFTLEPSTLLTLTPQFFDQEFANVYGHMQFSLPVTAGTKVALAVLLEPVDPAYTPTYFGEMFGNSWAGINIKENE